MSVTTNSFYGAVGKRKLYHIDKILDEKVKRYRSDRIPKEFRPRISGPSVAWKTFFRQQDAFSYARSKASDLHVFSFESESLESKTGQRIFLVASYEVFWHYYRENNIYREGISQFPDRQLEPQKRNHYEIIPEGAVSKLYFDLEFPKDNNINSDGSEITNIFIKYVILWLEEIFKVKCTREFVLDLDASTDKKFSRHLIFQLKKIGFKDNIHAGNFVKYILQKLKDEINKIKQNLSDVLDFDELPQFKDNMKGAEETESEKIGERQFSDDDRLDNLRTSKIMEAFTEGELLTLIVRDKNRQETLFCDQGVYTKNRNFRLYLSRKFRKCNPLVVSNDNLYQHSVKDETISEDHQIFNDSLIANIEYSPSLRILHFDSECKYSIKLSNDVIPASRTASEDVIAGFTKSPYPEIDDFISSTLKSHSKYGRIRQWTYFNQGELIVYDIVGYRYCHNIEREHKSNNIMLLADLKKGVYYQKCHDPECKLINFKSSDMEIPKEALPSYYFEDSFDEFDEGVDDMDILNAVVEVEKNLDLEVQKATNNI